MKVYIIFKQVINGCTNAEESVLAAVFSKEEYAKQYCDKYNKIVERYWYDEENVDEELEDIYD